MLRYERRFLSLVPVLVLCACGAKEAPATPPLPTPPTPCPSTAVVSSATTTTAPTIASASPNTSASTDAPPIASVSVSASASAAIRNAPPDPPLPTTPLSGTVDGRPFAAVSALAVKDPEDPDARIIWMFDRAVACGTKLPPPGVRAVSARAPWALSDGFASESLSSAGAKSSFHSVRGAVLEMTTQPGAKARLLLRVRSNTIDVAGEIRPSVCP